MLNDGEEGCLRCTQGLAPVSCSLITERDACCYKGILINEGVHNPLAYIAIIGYAKFVPWLPYRHPFCPSLLP